MEQQIDTLVFDLGGVIVNLNGKKVVEGLGKLGINRFKMFIYQKRINRLFNDYVDGVVDPMIPVNELKKICRKGTTTEDINKVVEFLCGEHPLHRFMQIKALRTKYKVYLLSNINEPIWSLTIKELQKMGLTPEDCFDKCFLSYEMHLAKPNASIYEQVIKETGLKPEHTLYFDDRKVNYEAGKQLGFQSVLVKTNHLEDCEEWQALI